MLTYNVTKKSGKGILNSVINNLPVELHIPGYNFCGPGTKLAKRIARGDIGINSLDEACKEHDLAYSREKDLNQRHKADRVLADKAVRRFKSTDASIGEKAAALAVAGAMKAKVKLGMGCGNKSKVERTKSKTNRRRSKSRKRRNTGGSLTFKDITKQARMALKGKNLRNMNDAIKVALHIAKRAKRKGTIKANRIIPIPKRGGFLPLIPLFAGLSALGALGGRAAGIAKAVNDA